MAMIKQFGGDGMAMRFASIILESDTEVNTLPVSKEDPTKMPLHNHITLSVGSEAFCPSSGNVFVLTEAGWIKL